MSSGRYGEDRALTRATRRAAVHVGVALLVTSVFVLLSVALVGAKQGGGDNGGGDNGGGDNGGDNGGQNGAKKLYLPAITR